MERHLDLCLDAGINIEGTNAEVAPGQWEYQTFAKGAAKAGDEMWVARYILERLAEEYGYQSTTIQSHWVQQTGMGLECMQISQTRPKNMWFKRNI